MNTVFNVVSDRVNDIQIPRGTRVGMLREILRRSGYDVKDAKIAVCRMSQEDKLVGETASYALQEGDTVEFTTRVIDLPGLAREIAQLNEPEQPKPTCPDCRVVGYSKRVNGFIVDVNRRGNDIRIVIFR